MRFGDKLKSWRRDHGLTQGELTRTILRVSAHHPRFFYGLMSKWENCKGYPTLQNLLIISAVTGMSMDYMLSEEIAYYRKKYIETMNERRVS